MKAVFAPVGSLPLACRGGQVLNYGAQGSLEA